MGDSKTKDQLMLMALAIDAVRVLHNPIKSGVEYLIGMDGGIKGTVQMLWCDECSQQFPQGKQCRTMTVIAEKLENMV